MIERIGNCRIIEEIGAGGMAVVYKAVQEPLGRVVGIKALKSSIAQETQFAERFEREARFMASLQQENILNVYDFIKYGGTMFIVMEYVEGIDLYDLLDSHKRLPPDIAAIVALQVARALNHAHFRGIIHRDIKPANIMISKRGDVKLMDFGIARDDTLSDLTETGTGLGTPSYMSPEQILGDKLDGRTDIWSLGVVFYQMLTGKKPFVEDAKRTVLQKIRLDRYVPARKINPQVPRVLERIIAKCMAKQRDDRYPSMQALIHDLEDYLAVRVTDNYNVVLVDYLRSLNIISEEEASGILMSGKAHVPVAAPREDKRALRSIVAVLGVALAVFLLSAVAIQVTAQDDHRGAEREPSQPAVTAADLGYLKIVAVPWAQVRIDDVLVGETPMAVPVALPRGKHFVELRNPYFQSKTVEVTIESGKTHTLKERLIPAAALQGRNR